MTGEYVAGRTRDQLELSCDTVVVGSGASGAVVADVLAAIGEQVVVLEEGPRVRPEEYGQMRPTEHMQSMWREGGTTAAFGIGKSPVINVTMGRCVGGSSALTGGVCFRTPGWVLDEWVGDHGLRTLSSEALEPHFDEIGRRASIGEVPVESRSKSTALWASGAEKLGWRVEPTARNTEGCVGRALCNFGCPEGAKQSVDVSFLPQAVSNGAIVVSDARVSSVMMNGDRAVGVRGKLIDENSREVGGLAVHAKRVILACGAAHTPLVLWATGIRNNQIGRNLTLHPAFRVIARFDEEVRGWDGALQSAFCDTFEEDGITLISVFVPPFAVAAGVPGVGEPFVSRARDLDKLAMFGGLIHDDGGGRIWRSPFGREPIMTYRMSAKDRALIPSVIRKVAQPFVEAGATELFLPVLGSDPISCDELDGFDLEHVAPQRFECSSQHPLGTTRMGTDKRHSVVDDRGRVWGTRGLHIVDGGILPTSLGVNPQWTIMTMAHRLASMMT